MVSFGLFGAGVIGSVHADNIIANPRTTLTAVYDPDELRASGAIVGINNSYGAPYGYDERIEVMGSKAMAQSDCKPLHAFRIFDDAGRHGSRLVDGWYAHMEHTYMDELNAFVDVLEGKPQTNATLVDGLRAQIIAEAAHVSQRENRPVAVDWAEVEELEQGS